MNKPELKPAVSFEDGVLPAEIDHIRERRAAMYPGYSENPRSLDPYPPNGHTGRSSDAVAAERLARTANSFEEAHRLRALGLAFSGGGIRSATFNLGIVQGLAEYGLLPYVDYLSTVSGGGYVGSWLHGLIRNRYDGDPKQAAKFLSPIENPIPDTPEHDPISFLRKYSNYLAPRPGLFSADSWVIGVIWLRNVLLNQLILVPAIAALVLVVLTFGFVAQSLPSQDARFETGSLIVAFVALAGATWLLTKNLSAVVRQTFAGRTTVQKTRSETFAERWSLATVPLVFVAGLLIGCGNLGRHDGASIAGLFIGLALLFATFQWAGGFHRCFVALHPHLPGKSVIALLHSMWMVPITAAFATGLIAGVWNWAQSAVVWPQLAFAPPLVVLGLMAGTSLLVGLMGADYPDAAREWMARVGAMTVLACAGWVVVFVLGVFGPWTVSWVLARYGATGMSAIGAWLATTVTGVLAGRSAKTGGQQESPKGKSLFERLITLTPVIFMIGYVLLISFGVHLTLRAIVRPPAAPSTSGNWLTSTFTPIAEEYEFVLSQPEALPYVVLLLAAAIAVTLIAASRININEFSLHHFYKNRLVRCYLGASNTGIRNPNRLTGFDPEDDFPISALRPVSPRLDMTAGNGDTAADPDRTSYRGPYAIVNTALNLNTGSELAKQERKAASFVFTPRFCGFNPSSSKEDKHHHHANSEAFDLAGYRSTCGYAFPIGPQIGTATAISGAAANPNMGYHTSGPMAFLLTVFDARLGWWLGNPRWRHASTRPGPVFALRYLFAELLGQTTGRSKFVNLSDGGHFDNLGIYELVRRRCRYIIVGDGEQDGGLTFGSLGSAIRLCRADFGVEIDIDPNPIRLVNGFSTVHCVVGRITYPEDEIGFSAGACEGGPWQPRDKARGWLLYLKSSLTGDEPADVVQYRSNNPEFPHQSTNDQFFSESQFESYRRLGLHIVRDAFEDVEVELTGRGPEELLALFQTLTRKWYAPVSVTAEAATRLADHYSQLMRRLSEDANLRSAYAELLPGGVSNGDRVAPKLDEAAYLYGLELLQLIENVYTEFRLQHGANRANPRNAGWMQVFGRWARSRVLYEHVWETAQQDYNPLFRQFVDELRESAVFDVPMRP